MGVPQFFFPFYHLSLDSDGIVNDNCYLLRVILTLFFPSYFVLSVRSQRPYGHLSQECFSFKCTSLYLISVFFLCRRLVCSVCILLHILSFGFVIVGHTYHQFCSLHALIFSFTSIYIYVHSFSVQCFLLHSVALVAVTYSVSRFVLGQY